MKITSQEKKTARHVVVEGKQLEKDLTHSLIQAS